MTIFDTKSYYCYNNFFLQQNNTKTAYKWIHREICHLHVNAVLRFLLRGDEFNDVIGYRQEPFHFLPPPCFPVRRHGLKFPLFSENRSCIVQKEQGGHKKKKIISFLVVVVESNHCPFEALHCVKKIMIITYLK